MTENLKTTHYNDTTAIPVVIGETAWSKLTTPAYCWYNNDSVTNFVTYGALYDIYTFYPEKLCQVGGTFLPMANGQP